jgi:hypothetical protein
MSDEAEKTEAPKRRYRVKQPRGKRRNPKLELVEPEEPDETPHQPMPDPVRRRSGSDLFDLDPVKMAALERRGIDTAIVKVRLYRLEGPRRVRIAGEFETESVTAEWVETEWGPGHYEVWGYNERSEYIAANRVWVGNPEEVRTGGVVALQGAAAGARAVADARADRIERLLEKLIEHQARPQQDPIRDSIAAMASLFQAQAAAQMQSLDMRMKVADHVNAPGERMQATLLELLKLERSKPADSGGGMGVLDTLKMGIALGARMNGAAVPALGDGEKKEDWLKFAGDLADNLGVPIVATFAQAMLPPEKANQVIEAINAHTERRIAEAEAATEPDDEEPTQ